MNSISRHLNLWTYLSILVVVSVIGLVYVVGFLEGPKEHDGNISVKEEGGDSRPWVPRQENSDMITEKVL